MRYREPIAVVQAVMMWNYNVDPEIKFNAVYDTEFNMDNAYCKEKLEAMRNLDRWWPELDLEHQRRLVRAALVKYGDEAGKRVDN